MLYIHVVSILFSLDFFSIFTLINYVNFPCNKPLYENLLLKNPRTLRYHPLFSPWIFTFWHLKKNHRNSKQKKQTDIKNVYWCNCCCFVIASVPASGKASCFHSNRHSFRLSNSICKKWDSISFE